MELAADVIAWLTDPAHWQGPAGIPTRLAEHVGLSAISLLIAIALALPVGLWIGHTRRAARLAINIANLGRAIPSLAVMGLVLPITAAIDPELGFKVYPTVVAMVVLAAPPILVNAYTGIAGVDPDLVEAARGMGMHEREVLTRAELPVAIPAVAGGIRSAAVQIVATATLGAIFGGPGLGRYLVEAIAQNDDAMLFSGVVLVAALSLATEMLFAGVQRAVTSPGLRRPSARPGDMAPVTEPAAA
jgi:osmoprotectant transport system permease protein